MWPSDNHCVLPHAVHMFPFCPPPRCPFSRERVLTSFKCPIFHKSVASLCNPSPWVSLSHVVSGGKVYRHLSIGSNKPGVSLFAMGTGRYQFSDPPDTRLTQATARSCTMALLQSSDSTEAFAGNHCSRSGTDGRCLGCLQVSTWWVFSS